MEDMNFDEMRNQIAILKNKIDNESIISDKLMRNVLKTKAGAFRRNQRIKMICGAYTILSAPYIFHSMLGLPWAFVIATGIFIAICIACTLYIYTPVADSNMMNGDLLEVARKMETFKKHQMTWNIIGFPLAFAWFGYLIYNLYHTTSIDPELIKAMIYGSSAGLFIGLCLAFKMIYKANKAANEIIEQIEE